MRFLAIAVLGVCMTPACSVDCTLEAKAGIAVLVVDSVSGGTVAANQVTVVAIDGTFRDSTQVPQELTTHPVQLAIERTGRYRVQVTATGYRPWVAEDVRVTEDECHVRPVELTARMQRLSTLGGGAPRLLETVDYLTL